MTNLINIITTAVSNTVLFTASLVMAGIGFALVGMLAVFALMAVGVAIIASPFITATQPERAKPEIPA